MKRIKETEVNLDKIRGSLVGGAVGDALGYAIEFWGEEQIFGKYGERGITEYELDSFTGKALISDDTQMTLFTANGLFVGDTRGAMRGIQSRPRYYYMPAAIVTHIINRIIFGEKKKTLKNIVIEARDKVAEIFRGDKHLKALTDIIDRAIELSGNEKDDLDNIHRLGEGWVAEETLGIALYCALRYQDDFSAGVISAVNHKGDSDSTGAVTGNILGALLGYDAIEEKWKTNLELIDVIIEMADDLCHGCQMSEFGHYEDVDWTRKYIYMQWKDEKLDPAK